MILVIGVRFKQAGKIYYFSPGELDLQLGQSVLVETSRGIELGEVAEPVKEVVDADVVQPLKQVVRVATTHDLTQVNTNHNEEQEAFQVAQTKIQQHGLDMKLVNVEYTFDRSKLVFSFTSEKRVDFRELVKDLAACFRTRIELRQIGVRDEAKIVGGLGVCGRALCCAAWMSEFEPVSIRQAKEQDLAMNPNKISGVCGRLKCCLRFESDAYEDARSVLPKMGDKKMTPGGEGRVVALHVLRGQYVVQAGDGVRYILGLDGVTQATEAEGGQKDDTDEGACACDGCAGCQAEHVGQVEPATQAEPKRPKRPQRPHPSVAAAANAVNLQGEEEIAAGSEENAQEATRKKKRWRKRRPKPNGNGNSPRQGESPSEYY